MKIYLSITLFLFLSACSSYEPLPPEAYTQSIETYTAGDIQYAGAYNNFNYRATLLNTSVQNAVIERKKEVYLWDEVKTQQELATFQKDNGTATKVFLSFYTPNRLDDNLASPKSIWAVYLETPSGRYTGSVKKIRSSGTELVTLYPYHTRFATAYNVEFPVALNSIESQQSKLTITGPLGVKTVVFANKQ